MHGIPPISTLLPILFNEASCMQFLIDRGVFYTERICPSCTTPMNLYHSQMSYMCPKKICRKKISIKSNSFFAGCKLPVHQVLHLAYLWLCKTSPSSTETQSGLSRPTISNFFHIFASWLLLRPCPKMDASAEKVL